MHSIVAQRQNKKHLNQMLFVVFCFIWYLWNFQIIFCLFWNLNLLYLELYICLDLMLSWALIFFKRLLSYFCKCFKPILILNYEIVNYMYYYLLENTFLQWRTKKLMWFTEGALIKEYKSISLSVFFSSQDYNQDNNKFILGWYH
jgi:hypothetical protein